MGKVNIPASVGGRSISHDEDNDEVEDALTPEFRKLLTTVTRELVDKQPTRCPHIETAERMTKVCPITTFSLPHILIYDSGFFVLKSTTILLEAQSPALSAMSPQGSVSQYLTSLKRC